MKYNNKYGLPDSMVLALKRNEREYENNKWSITELINPPKIVQLIRRHKNEIEVDISEMIWSLLGTAVHSYIDNRSSSEDNEKRISATIGEYVITGQPDRIEDKTLIDYKVCGAYTVMNGVKPEWEQQINFYKYLLEKNNIFVDEAYIVAIIRDWSVRYKGQKNYPNVPIVMLKVNLWDYDIVVKKIVERVTLHAAAQNTINENDIQMCSTDERWGGKRCADYCIVAKFCNRNI